MVLPSLHVLLGIFKKLSCSSRIVKAFDKELFAVCLGNISGDDDEDDTPPVIRTSPQCIKEGSKQKHQSWRRPGISSVSSAAWPSGC